MAKKILYTVGFLVFVYVIINFLILDNSSRLSVLKEKIPLETKTKIKKYFFPYKYIKKLESNEILIKKELDLIRKRNRDIGASLNEKDKLLSKINEKIGYTRFYEVNNKKIRIMEKNFQFKEFKDDFLEIKKHGDARSGSIYVDKVEDKIIILTASGNLQYFLINDLKKKEFITKVIKTNIKDLIKYENFYSNSNYGIKDLLIFNDYLYFSFNREVKNKCFNTSILRAKLNYDFLNFEEFFYPKECVSSDMPGFTPHSAGGRMVKYKDKIIFSSGEYLNRMAAQDKNSILGKILLIDTTDPKLYKLVSMGHRNVQGLYFDEDNETLVSTEHGPMGGDEVNINKDFLTKTNNFGWPISSYGEHYGFKKRNDSHELYKKAPLYKSHKKYGFVEPIQYFVPSIGISEIVKLSTEMGYNIERNNFLFGALGRDPSEGDMSLHFVVISNDYSNIEKHEVVNINSRIRDIMKIDQNNILVMLETSSTIGLLSLEN